MFGITFTLTASGVCCSSGEGVHATGDIPEQLEKLKKTLTLIVYKLGFFFKLCVSVVRSSEFIAHV